MDDARAKFWCDAFLACRSDVVITRYMFADDALVQYDNRFGQAKFQENAKPQRPVIRKPDDYDDDIPF